MSKVLIIASQHGDELSGEKLYAYICSHHPELTEQVKYIIGNPQARKRGVRFIESDLNRSYIGSKDTYEQRRARKILKIIKDGRYELVLDMHTTTVKQPPCLITASINPDNDKFLQATTIERIVTMPEQIAKTSLIGVCPQSVAIEVNEHIAEEVLEELCNDLSRYIKNETILINRYVYEVSEPLQAERLSGKELAALKNFRRTEAGYYPVLVGEESYKKYYQYVGFKAHARYEYKA